MSATNCKACLATKSPSTCKDCIKKSNFWDSVKSCTLCANIQSKDARAACVTEVSKGAYAPGNCLSVESGEDLNNPRSIAYLEKCFSCVAKVPDAAKPGCVGCYSFNVAKSDQDACNKCVVAGSGSGAGLGCSGCLSTSAASRKSQCLSCLTRAKSGDDGKACGSCSDGNNVPGWQVDGCYSCALTAKSSQVKSGCSMLSFLPYNEVKSFKPAPGSEAVIKGYYACLAAFGSKPAGKNCGVCAGSASAESQKQCYACLARLPDDQGSLCSWCWSDRAMKAGKSQECESCVKKTKGDYSCWGNL